MADHAEVAIADGASGQPPDFVNLCLVSARFNTKGLILIRFDFSKAARHFVQGVRDNYHLAIDETDKFVGVRRVRILPRFFVDARRFAVEFQDGVDAYHDLALLRLHAFGFIQDSNENLVLREESKGRKSATGRQIRKRPTGQNINIEIC
jgi:hypothetical protein